MDHTISTSIEKRKFPRLYQQMPISILDNVLIINKSTCKDISEGGLCLEVELNELNEKAIWAINSNDTKIDIELSLANGHDNKIKATAIIKWNKPLPPEDFKRFDLGLEFTELDAATKNRLSAYITERLNVKKQILPGLHNCTLLIDEEEVDTGVYEYFPYANKMVLDPFGTLRKIKQLNNGTVPEEYKDYIYARYCVGNSYLNQKAIESAYRASKKIASLSISTRKKILEDIHELLLAHKEKLIEIFIVEGHPRKLAEWEFLGMETAYRQATLNFYASETWKEMVKGGKESIYIVRKPDGVVCLNPPRNAPTSNSLLAAFTYLAGNVLIVKPPLKCPLSTIYLWKNVIWEALKRNNAPKGSLNIITGNSNQIMDEWLTSPYVNDIIYFGDSQKGLEIGNKCWINNKKAVLELSGNDMMLVWEDADVDKAASALIDGFLGSTQICMVPKKALVHENIYDSFLAKFIEETKKLKIGPPSDPETYFSPVMKMKEFFDFLDNAKKMGAKVVYGGIRIDHNGTPSDHGAYIKPTILQIDNIIEAKNMKCIQEENFFPLMPIVKISGKSNDEIFQEMIDMVDNNKYGLRCSVWVKSNNYIDKFIHEINNSGLLRINSKHVGFSFYISTHGGTGKSGGPYGEMNYIWQRTAHLQGISITHL